MSVTIRIKKEKQWEVVTEIRDLFGSPAQVAMQLRSKGINATKVNTEVHIIIPEDAPF